MFFEHGSYYILHEKFRVKIGDRSPIMAAAAQDAEMADLEDITGGATFLAEMLKAAPFLFVLAVSTKGGVNVRAEPSTASKAIGSILDKTNVVVGNVLRPDDGTFTWAVVLIATDKPGISLGFVAAKFLALPDECPEGYNVAIADPSDVRSESIGIDPDCTFNPQH